MVPFTPSKEVAVAGLDRLEDCKSSYEGDDSEVVTYVEGVHAPPTSISRETEEPGNIVTKDHCHEVSAADNRDGHYPR